MYVFDINKDLISEGLSCIFLSIDFDRMEDAKHKGLLPFVKQALIEKDRVVRYFLSDLLDDLYVGSNHRKYSEEKFRIILNLEKFCENNDVPIMSYKSFSSFIKRFITQDAVNKLDFKGYGHRNYNELMCRLLKYAEEDLYNATINNFWNTRGSNNYWYYDPRSDLYDLYAKRNPEKFIESVDKDFKLKDYHERSHIYCAMISNGILDNNN